MFRLGSLFAAMCLGGVLVYVGLFYHVVRTEQEWAFVAKTEPGFSGTYADVRAWELAEWREHPRLVEALAKGDREDLLPKPEPRTLLDRLLRPLGTSEVDDDSQRH